MLASFVLLVHNLLVSVMTTRADHWCKQPSEYANLTSKEWRSIGVPVDASGSWLQCVRYDPPLSENSDNRTQVPCEEWDYETNGSIITEWNLVCNQRWLVPFATIIYMSGAAVAAPIMGELSDKVGRKQVIYMAVLSLLLSGMAVCFSRSVTLFLALRFWVSASVSTVQITSFVLLFELSTPAYQCLYSVMAFTAPLIAAPLFLSLIDLLAQKWVVVQAVVMLPTSLLLSTFILTIESPRWLMVTAEYMQAERVILQAARINGCSIHDVQRQWRLHNTSFYGHDHEASSRSKLGFVGVLTSRVLRRRVVILFWCWFVVILAYYHTHTGRADNVWLRVVEGTLAGCGSLLLYMSATKFGRRVTLLALLVAFSMLAGGAAVAMMFEGASVLLLSVDTGSVILADLLVILLFTYSVELFPTVVRSMGMCAAYFFGRLGGISQPLLEELGSMTQKELVPGLLGVLGIAAALAVNWLPETMSMGVMNTVQDLEDVERIKIPRRLSKLETRYPGSAEAARRKSHDGAIVRSDYR
ncbi:solute carrier, putative [Ixodes scapularis]|uniref:Solute carrier, putative n=1 Tax=Ixodes scapularis TaxID=6945 RepID=B7PH62_IXOSC|nr:solute carrier, putative [Ixodes scapularis]|eukprot:XP_002402262.1 solute carrier, putative [Ixodes scapularis]